MNNIQTVTVYLGSSGRCRPLFKETAEELGTLIGNKGKSLVFGGMDSGLMGIVANNALNAGAHVTGIVPKTLKDSERMHPDLQETILVPSLWERKLKMFHRADATITLAGGFGTIDEILEVLHWADLGSHDKPIVLINTEGYYDDFITFLGTLPDLPRNHFILADSPEDAFNKLEAWQPPKVANSVDNLYPHFEDEILAETEGHLVIDGATVKNTYVLATALGLKQLQRHDRPIGILDTEGKFAPLMKWIKSSQDEKFITDHCMKLFSIDNTIEGLNEKLANQPIVNIDLHVEKWGPSETRTHIELKEKE